MERPLTFPVGHLRAAHQGGCEPSRPEPVGIGGYAAGRLVADRGAERASESRQSVRAKGVVVR